MPARKRSGLIKKGCSKRNTMIPWQPCCEMSGISPGYSFSCSTPSMPLRPSRCMRWRGAEGPSAFLMQGRIPRRTSSGQTSFFPLASMTSMRRPQGPGSPQAHGRTATWFLSRKDGFSPRNSSALSRCSRRRFFPPAVSNGSPCAPRSGSAPTTRCCGQLPAALLSRADSLLLFFSRSRILHDTAAR